VNDVLQIEDQFYVRATSGLTDDRTRVLKYGTTLGVFDRFGDIESLGQRRFGLFHDEARHLSRFRLTINNDRPLLLSSGVHHDNVFLSVDLTNLDTLSQGSIVFPKGAVHVFRQLFLKANCLFHAMRVINYGLTTAELSLRFDFDADFADIFEVRGAIRNRPGTRLQGVHEGDAIRLAYRGLDSVERTTKIHFSPPPPVLTARQAVYQLSLESREEFSATTSVSCERSGRVYPGITYEEARSAESHPSRHGPFGEVWIETSSKPLDGWLARSRADLEMLMVGNPEGNYPYAGVPWFNTVFGRDGIITALQCMWIAPSIASSVLEFLAATQARTESPEQDAQPGKVLHEMRRGEMAATGEVPFARYYGSVDSTPLFVMLAAAYLERTNDVVLIERLWPAIQAAMDWIDEFGDTDGDGFVEYSRQSADGLVQQGWKDSYDSVFHANGELALAPIALCEVQGYVYAAKRGAAQIARALGDGGRAEELDRQAESLKEHFQKAFWSDELGCYGLALDAEKELCRVRTSNAGHAMFCGIASPSHAEIMSRTLFEDHFFSGWGIRTLSALETRYNPMSYHNGSVWPHDNSLIGKGLGRYGFGKEAARLLSSLFEATSHMDLGRTPELFCGFHRRGQDAGGPTLYPVACSPQAWSAAAPFVLIEACIGVGIGAGRRQISFLNSWLPAELDWIRVENVAVSDAVVDIAVSRHKDSVDVEVFQKGRPIEIVNARQGSAGSELS
jgi:glycogen debranching enzyme